MRQTIEECGELICALSHHLRGRISNVTEELADVEIMCQQLRLLIGDDAVDRAKAQKLDRLRERLAAISLTQIGAMS